MLLGNHRLLREETLHLLLLLALELLKLLDARRLTGGLLVGDKRLSASERDDLDRDRCVVVEIARFVFPSVVSFVVVDGGDGGIGALCRGQLGFERLGLRELEPAIVRIGIIEN